MNKNDKGFAELLDLLKTHPDLIDGLVFDPENVKKLLNSDEARGLALGTDVEDFLRAVADPDDGGPIAVCSRSTKALCKGNTRVEVLCLGGTAGGRRN